MVVETPRLLPRTSLLMEDWASLRWCDAGGALCGRALELQKCGASQRLILATMISAVSQRAGIAQEFNQSRYSQNVSTFGICIALKKKVR